jgi:hypothetical protein
LTDEQLLTNLKLLLARCGTLSGILIDETDGMPSSACYRNRFGSLARAYSLIGYTPLRNFEYIEINRALRQLHREKLGQVLDELRGGGARVRQNQDQTFEINGEFTASFVFARCRVTPAQNHRWLIRLDNSLSPDVTIAARLQPDNRNILDYYLLPAIDRISEQLRLAPNNGIILDVYRFENLNFFFKMARRAMVAEAA